MENPTSTELFATLVPSYGLFRPSRSTFRKHSDSGPVGSLATLDLSQAESRPPLAPSTCHEALAPRLLPLPATRFQVLHSRRWEVNARSRPPPSRVGRTPLRERTKERRCSTTNTRLC